jgi:hypothetical protein
VTAFGPRHEAALAVDGEFDVRVLEPSPPAVGTEPYSDDPTALEPRDVSKPLLSPVTNGDRTWDDYCREHADFSEWCAERWLGAWRRLPALSDRDALHRTVDAWHTLGERVIATARHRANGKIGLRWTLGGFGTPFFGDDEQLRVTGHLLVRVSGRQPAVHEIETLGAAAEFAGVEPGVPGGLFEATTDGDPARRLAIDHDAAHVLAEWYGFVMSVLAQLRVDFASSAPALVQLWPEHFDLATDLGAPRANYGASPGDAEHPEPYLYAGPWDTAGLDRSDAYWNEPFGASLPYAAIVDAADQRKAALDFFHAAAARLAAQPR